jgi:hypothetical protein
MSKEPLRSLSSTDIEARIRGHQFRAKKGPKDDSRSAARATQLILELIGRGIDVKSRNLAIKSPENIRVN